ncbi:MAG: phosphotransferase [Clostridia bacterium]|nr:phosphotransferase [Clostridia bacterium]
MKITQMLKREDFYTINQKTLAKFFEGQNGRTTLYVYPKLNAIVTRLPAKTVRDYLLNEYAVRGSFLKKMLVQGYVRLCLLSCGLLADKKAEVPADCKNDLLIYPCNKKYRVFHFDKNEVDVLIKDGFDDSDLVHEKEFRTRSALPSFVPSLVSVSENGYREKIIDGMPLARIHEGFLAYRDEAYALLSEYGKAFEKTVPCAEYVSRLTADIQSRAGDKVKDKQKLFAVCEKLCKTASALQDIPLGFSHGDLQAGNIWIENNTKKIYIIDWESWGERSLWYDRAVLTENLRPGGLTEYLPQNGDIAQKAVVLLEDLIFQLNELNSLPMDFGEQNFEAYLDTLVQWDALNGKE